MCRERQARFREKKRVRAGFPANTAAGNQGEGGSQAGGMSSGGGQGGEGQEAAQEVNTLADLQKVSAQLAGYYTGLTQGLGQEEHQAVMRYFLEGLREVPPPYLPPLFSPAPFLFPPHYCL